MCYCPLGGGLDIVVRDLNVTVHKVVDREASTGLEKHKPAVVVCLSAWW